MDQHFLILRAARSPPAGPVTRICDEEARDTFHRITLGFQGGKPYCSDCESSKVYPFSEPPIREKRAGCLKKFSGTLFHCPQLPCPFFSPVAGIAGFALLGLSQLGLLHFGQTLGFSPFSRGSHSWPQRHRQPSNNTIPIWVSSDPIISSPLPVFTIGIYDCSCI